MLVSVPVFLDSELPKHSAERLYLTSVLAVVCCCVGDVAIAMCWKGEGVLLV